MVVGQLRQVFWCTVGDMLSARDLTGKVHVIIRVASGIGFTASKARAVKNVTVVLGSSRTLASTSILRVCARPGCLELFIRPHVCSPTEVVNWCRPLPRWIRNQPRLSPP